MPSDSRQLQRRIDELEKELQQIRREARLFRSIFERAEEAIIVADASGRSVIVNRATCDMLGYTEKELLAKDIFDLLAPNAATGLFPILTNRRRSGRLKTQLQRVDGTAIDVEVAGYPVDLDGEPAALGMIRNIGEQLSLERQLRQAQKMDAVGQLAGGIAHDFNNVLTAILGHAQMGLEFLHSGEPGGLSAMEDSLHQIEHAALRAGALTKHLLSLSRREPVRLTALDLCHAIDEMGPVLRQLIGENIRLVFRRPEEPMPVLADEGSLQQILLNLAVNARDAMPRGGVLTLGLSAAEQEPGEGSDQDAKRSLWALSVTDTGCGMDPEVVDRIFEPFSTTKPRGRGTGLGLSTVYGLVRDMAGKITVTSQPGEGSTFTVLLPRSAAASSVHAPAESPPARGEETLLVCEDDELVRVLARRVLERQGFRVLEASDAEAALELVRHQKKPIDLLITDVIMPGMAGPALAETLAGEIPPAKVLFISGYADELISRQGLDRDKMNFLQKPLRPSELIRRVREILDEA